VDIYAPSKDIYSSWGPLTSYDPNNVATWQDQTVTYANYVNLSGTSMAAPHVTGVAAAILQRNPGLTPAQVESQIRGSSYNLGRTDMTFGCADIGGCAQKSVTNPVASVHDNAKSSRMVNISTRSYVGTGNDVLIGSFTVAAGGKRVLIQGRGPSLGYPTNVGLQNPTLVLVRLRDGAIIASNDDWQSAPNAAEISASGYGLPDSRESVILTTLAEGGAYSAILSGIGNTTGIGHVSVSEIDHPEIELIGLSTRSYSNTGEGLTIGGIIIQPGVGGYPNEPRTVLVRVKGPSLTANGITDPLFDPIVTFIPSGSDPQPAFVVNNWTDRADWPEVHRLGASPSDPREVTFLVDLLPNIGYSVFVQGVGGTTGVATLEVYPQ